MPSIANGAKPIPVFGAIPGMIGTIQATMAIKYLMTGEIPLLGKLLIFNGDTMIFEQVSFDKNPQCKVCGPK
jgi:molybdopterin/thiamine biosynthesis adenylyltransferase